MLNVERIFDISEWNHILHRRVENHTKYLSQTFRDHIQSIRRQTDGWNISVPLRKSYSNFLSKLKLMDDKVCVEHRSTPTYYYGPRRRIFDGLCAYMSDRYRFFLRYTRARGMSSLDPDVFVASFLQNTFQLGKPTEAQLQPTSSTEPLLYPNIIVHFLRRPFLFQMKKDGNKNHVKTRKRNQSRNASQMLKEVLSKETTSNANFVFLEYIKRFQ